jgi:tetratricopeptide (TPR) repeat protein
MWQQDIDSNRLSVAASDAAEAHHQSGAFDQLHSDDFLLYAYLQSGHDKNSKSLLEQSDTVMTRLETMPHLSTHGMSGMFDEYRSKFAAIYALEMRDWKTAAQLEPIPAATPQAQTITYWARTVAAGHLHQPKLAQESLARFESLLDKVRQGSQAYLADSTFEQIRRSEMLGWTAFASGDTQQALNHMHTAADLQDKVGQAEVDIPAREMLADILLESSPPAAALSEYQRALVLSPNRFNGLYHAGLAAEQSGDKALAAKYYEALMKSTDNGSQSTRVEFAHVKDFVATTQVANTR